MVDARGGGFHVAYEVHHRARGHRLDRVADDGLGDGACLAGDGLVLGLGLIHRVQHLLGRVARLLGHVVEPAAGIGQVVGGDLQVRHHAELLQRVVQQPREVADLGVDLLGGTHGDRRSEQGHVFHVHAVLLRLP